MRRYAYFYFMKEEPDRVRAVAPSHVAHWHGFAFGDYLGGPFGDRRGGLITFAAESEAEATRAVADDPFVKAGLLREHWLKEWVIE